MNPAIDFDAVCGLVAAKYITARKHPTADLFIYNYTPKAMWESRWTPETMACRGLIADGQDRIVARPFEKFFNYGELEGKIPAEPFEVYGKLDGCLGILYWIGDEPFIATRGSFESEQAVRATEILRTKKRKWLPYLQKDWTYLFEFISPRFRIVVDYGGIEDLFLLAAIHTETGQEVPLDDLLWQPKANLYDNVADLSELKKFENDRDEGFVVRFRSGLRCKMKFTEYLRLHKILTRCSSKSIWESLRDGKLLDEILEHVPDEFYKYVKKTETELRRQYAEVEARAKRIFDARPMAERKYQAIYFTSHSSTPAVLFNMLDGKDYSGIIWKFLRPKFEKPFRTDIDDA